MRFSNIGRSSSIRRLRTVFSSVGAAPSTPSSSNNSSPTTRASSPDSSFESPSSSMHSSRSSASRIDSILANRLSPSNIDLETEDEARTFPSEVELLEPRPRTGPVAGGIFEVLDGRV